MSSNRPLPGRFRKQWHWLILVLAAAVVVPVVFTTPDDPTGQSPPAGSVGAGLPTEILPTESKPTETKMPRPEDRDTQAVTVALRALDPCLLASAEVARSNGVPNAVTIPTGPHSCLLVADADYSVVDSGVAVQVGEHSDLLTRYGQAPVTIGGARAYEYSATDTSSMCRVVIPVSAARSVELSYQERVVADMCPLVRRHAEAAVAKLRAPESVPGNERPFGAWDGCSLVAELLGPDAGKYRYKPAGLRDPFAGCHTALVDGGGESGPRLEIHYSEAPRPIRETRQIAGRTVELAQVGEDCMATWDDGPSGNQSRWFAATVVELTAQDCETTTRLVARLVAVAGQRPADGAAAPQRPLLYGPDDNDTAGRGACVDLAIGGDDDCEPYQEVDVPADPDEILDATNRHVQCAVFKEAVEAEFGAAYRAVTWAVHGFFVAPDHVLEISVNVNPVDAAGDYGRGGLHSDRRETKIAGQPAVTFWDNNKNSFDIYLSPNGDLSAPGNLHLGLRAMGGRGTDHGAQNATVDRKQAEAAIKVMATVVEKYFA